MDAETVVRALFELWNAERFDELGTCLAPEVDHDGRLDTVAEMAAWHRDDAATWAGARYGIVSLVSNGDQVAVRWRATARHVGAWGPVPATDREVTWDGVHIFTVTDGLVTALWAIADRFAKAQQLGVVMSPA